MSELTHVENDLTDLLVRSGQMGGEVRVLVAIKLSPPIQDLIGIECAEGSRDEIAVKA